MLVAQPGPNDGLSFNGADQFFIMPDSDNINTTTVQNRTIETYFKVTDGTDRQVFYKEGAQVNTIKFYVENGDLYVGSYRNNGGNNKSIWFRTPVANNTWYHVALVIDNASRLLFYLNGQLQATNTNYFELPFHPGNFEIARTAGPARYPNCNTWGTNGNVEECLGDVTNTDQIQLFYEGRIYGFRIWDDVRTEQEIMTNMNVLITDPTSDRGEDLIAFIDGNVMVFKDDDGDFDTQESSGNVLSLEDFTESEFKIYVENNFLNVESTDGILPEGLVLYDLIGKVAAENSNATQLPVNQLSDGVYILRINHQGMSVSKKVLIQRKY